MMMLLLGSFKNIIKQGADKIAGIDTIPTRHLEYLSRRLN